MSWHKEPRRHSLARRGIKTSTKDVQDRVMKKETGIFEGSVDNLFGFDKNFLMNALNLDKNFLPKVEQTTYNELYIGGSRNANKNRPLQFKEREDSFKNIPILNQEKPQLLINKKPLYLLGTFNKLFSKGDKVKFYDKYGKHIKTATKKGDKVHLEVVGMPKEKVVLETNDDLLYEKWFDDRGSILFNAPKNSKYKGELLKLATEGDKIESVL